MHREGAFLTASPNPVPIGGTGGLRGTTTISWSTGDGSEGQVYLAVRGQPEQLFAQGSRGSQEAPWISPSATFEFRLYAGTEHKVLLDSEKVVAQDEAWQPWIVKEPDLVPPLTLMSIEGVDVLEDWLD
jgi:hypothetical protein